MDAITMLLFGIGGFFIVLLPFVGFVGLFVYLLYRKRTQAQNFAALLATYKRPPDAEGYVRVLQSQHMPGPSVSELINQLGTLRLMIRYNTTPLGRQGRQAFYPSRDAMPARTSDDILIETYSITKSEQVFNAFEQQSMYTAYVAEGSLFECFYTQKRLSITKDGKPLSKITFNDGIIKNSDGEQIGTVTIPNFASLLTSFSNNPQDYSICRFADGQECKILLTAYTSNDLTRLKAILRSESDFTDEKMFIGNNLSSLQQEITAAYGLSLYSNFPLAPYMDQL